MGDPTLIHVRLQRAGDQTLSAEYRFHHVAPNGAEQEFVAIDRNDDGNIDEFFLHQHGADISIGPSEVVRHAIFNLIIEYRDQAISRARVEAITTLDCVDTKSRNLQDTPGPTEYRIAQDAVSVIADQTFSSTLVTRFAAQLPDAMQSVLNFWDIDSPWQHNFVLYLSDAAQHPTECTTYGERIAGTGMHGSARLGYTGAEIAHLNGTAPIQRLDATPVAMHELAHALRFLLHWTAEEGAATYAEKHLTNPLNAPLIFSATLPMGSVIPLGETASSEDILYLESLDAEDHYHITISSSDDRDLAATWAAPGPTPCALSDLAERYIVASGTFFIRGMRVIGVERLNEDYATVTIYDNLPEAHYQKMPHCLEIGLIPEEYDGDRIATAEGDILPISLLPNATTAPVVATAPQTTPYVHLTSYQRTGVHGEFYPTSFCFWEMLGYTTAQYIMRAAAQHAKTHQLIPEYFPLFVTVGEATKTSVQATRDYFAQFSVNPWDMSINDDSLMPMGGICWE